MRELILGGQKSGKSRLAESRARAWLAQSDGSSLAYKAVLIATGLAHDEEMRERIARHQADRRASLPALQCVEESVRLGERIGQLSDERTLLIVDCLTLWLTQLLMPSNAAFLKRNQEFDLICSGQYAIEMIVSLRRALTNARGPVVLVSNEIGLGVIPLGADVRRFVDELGKLNQAVAAQCERVTFVAAGCALSLKDVR